MPEVEKLSQTHAASEPSKCVPNLIKLVQQQLLSLRSAGLTHLPKGGGKFQFDNLDSDPIPASTGADEPGTATSTTPTSAAKNLDAAGQGRASGSTSPSSTPSSATKTEGRAKPAGQTEPAVNSVPTHPTPPNTSAATDSLNLSQPYGPSVGIRDRVAGLNVIQQEVAGCTQCPKLASNRTQTVFGTGNPAARLVFVGEGPGAQEDRLGEPFVGEAGQLLDKIMAACKLSRHDVYILNTVKCRPPSNRNPAQDELANCWGYAERQLEIIQPEFICCLGSVASRTLLKTTQSLGRLRRQFHQYRGSRVLVTYHPAYLLRTPSAKRHVWEDMQLLMQEMGVDLSK